MAAVQFQFDPDRLQIWTFYTKYITADAVLIYPSRSIREHQNMMILKGSTFQRREVKSLRRNVKKVRQSLYSLGKVHGESVWSLSEHVVFDSPSLAAGVVSGNEKDGWEVWVER